MRAFFSGKLRGLAMLAALAAAGLTVCGSKDVFGRAYGPKGKLLVSKPQFVWEVWATDPDRIVGATATLDGLPVRAFYDSTKKRIIAEPAAPISPGKHSVTIVAQLPNEETFKKEWEIEVLESPMVELPEPDQFQKRSLSWVNEFRRQIGQPEFFPDDRMNIASLLHCKYHAQNNSTGHYQTEGKPGFFGADPADRVAAVGYVGDSWETVEFGSSQPEEALRNLVDAPYHRIPFLQPGAIAFGSGFHAGRLTATFGMSTEEHTALYPYEGQKDVPVKWDKNERPNPLRIHPRAKRPVGYPVMLVHFSKTPTTKIDILTAVLLDAAGNEVPCFLNTPANDNNLTNAVILMPEKALAPSTTYTAKVSGTLESGTPFLREWSFTTRTAAAAPPSELRAATVGAAKPLPKKPATKKPAPKSNGKPPRKPGVAILR